METLELYCHDCGHYLRFKRKPWKNGKIIIVCDYCGHQHCRYVVDGYIRERWDQRNGMFQKVSKVHGVMSNSSLWEDENK